MARQSVPTDINEEYYQISEEILSSFPKYRPPVDLFRFREDILSLAPYSRKGQRLSNEQVEEVQALCKDGNLFVSRSDHHIYSEHIVKQLDLVLQDAQLMEGEIADICMRALMMRFDEFAQQPVRPVFEKLYKDLMVCTEWIWQDKHRSKNFVRRIFRDEEATLAKHSYNGFAVGTWLWMNCGVSEYRRRELDRMALAMFLHDIGMAKLPQFILAKPGSLKGDERDKVLMHPLLGAKLMQRVEIVFDELTHAILEHHERLDGSGYPQHSKGEAISRTGRIAAIVDSFSAMILKRPFVPQVKTIETAMKELMSDGKHYDTQLCTILGTAFAAGTFGDMSKPAPEAKPKG